ncbi:MAG TPA: class I lanthipeptide [Chitinophaga sp.]|uniref:class I lanthipeptide n=1 Tax=Chitinophaga sp. TaxID=1869181 RepID=UPI002CB0AF03|nr:class I lanthipeptide [Chitinophaga sp.]HVI45066.1 class I lanthipeptide [Chitinophaga sp.]
MKKKQVSLAKKLTLKKIPVAKLSTKQQEDLKGGICVFTDEESSCPTYCGAQTRCFC